MRRSALIVLGLLTACSATPAGDPPAATVPAMATAPTTSTTVPTSEKTATTMTTTTTTTTSPPPGEAIGVADHVTIVIVDP